MATDLSWAGEDVSKAGRTDKGKTRTPNVTPPRTPVLSPYAASGVDVDAADALVKRIMPYAVATTIAGVIGGLGGFGGVFDIAACGIDDPLLVAANDGVGTKLKIAIEAQRHDTIGVDLVAMSVNDLIVQGAKPLFFLDYFATGALDVDVAESVISGIAAGCQQAECALLGGETAEMPGLYADGDYDLAGFAVGAVSRPALLPRLSAMRKGDHLIGIASSGLHANGYSLVRKMIADQKIILADQPNFVDQLLMPTRIYTPLLPLLADEAVRGLAHITGGGFTENLPRILPPELAAEIDLATWARPAIYHWLADNIARDEMLRTFNCGIGMVLVVDATSADALLRTLADIGETAYSIGRLTTRNDQTVLYRGAWTKA